MMSYIELQNSLIKRILDIQAVSVLEQIDKILSEVENKERTEFSSYEKQIIEYSIHQVSEGKFLSNEEVFEKSKKWLSE